ncbi:MULTISPECIES: monovalent cation/H+ antiporter subunit D [Xanthomonas]|uniref:Monovalent cation/H+ antiporter subunit D n=1 Tax=Xanthomonas phaseoli pv. dieffenbachiae TaxID=92828 RepID=A0A1V9H065_9XANT|nr:monovalent cation/H+ antiporter subunit D [Xanthomonas phaseoli]MBO9768895.1 monovalent cation/H+ antiporter subunit D [Xanthomonas phaseoli pv. dieffenbachiae]MBO9774283.1 monovalent cation/H+ antiporter subunit D [Xanthomonas phaseoli pv. dieffenbachiae]MBO9780374.1 monovalent cation/H+ antiporter subunit D [Xanthomonas phaseoli pv. dieffenbachiae]MBO9789501.1 monovalent cation/H+ antiporter subunit D [Xanthomonas phaseoli pv. dieffenbachiae]MBO9795836.1 monovalent cation/H+ antiporter su
MNHLLILPILIPMLGASASLFVEHRRYGPRVQRSVAWVSIALLAAAVIALFARAANGQILVYLLGDWPARIGIVLMGDRLSAWMLLTTLILGSACLLHACAGWDRRAPHFHALFQFQLMGLNGAFLTGDIFNLFVFFEVMLIASYGLLLSGGRGLQMRVGLHYVVFNVCASTLFLIALGLLFGVFGTLNMAELSQRIADLPAQDVPLAKATLGLLLLVFCSKAALLPLYLWLPETYSRAPAAVAALFAIMTKVGLYAVLRVSSLWFGAGALQGFGRHALLWLGIATLLMAAFGVMAASRLRVMVSYLVVFSAATLFIAFSLDDAGALGAGLYYLPHSSFVAAALFMISDLIRRRRGSASDRKEVVAPLPGRAIPGTMFMIAAVAVAGLPPLSGFLAKAALLQHVPEGLVGPVWTAVLGSSLLIVIGLTRAGVRLFWRVPAAAETAPELQPPRRGRMRPVETAATVLLLGGLVAMTGAAGPLMHYTDAAAAQLRDPGAYVDQVRATTPQRRQP